LDLLQKLSNPSTQTEPSLVVVPSSVLSNWEKEVAFWCPHFKAFRYHATSQADRSELAEDFFKNHLGTTRIVLTTSAVLRNKEDRSSFFKRINFDCLVVDEAHHMKNDQASIFRDVQRGITARRRLLLTGTPVHNSLKELGNLLTLLLQAHGCTDKKINRVVKELDDIVERGSLRTLQVRAAPLMLRRLKKDVMSDLPSKEGRTVRCQMTSLQRDIYEQELKDVKAAAGGDKFKTKKARTDFVKHCFSRFRRLCNHPLLTQSKLDEEDYVRLTDVLRTVRKDFANAPPQKGLGFVKAMSDYEVACLVKDTGILSRLGCDAKFSVGEELLTGSAKVVELLNLLQQQRELGRKTLVFSQFTNFLDLIGEALQRSGYDYLRLDGSTKIEDRQIIVDRFQDEASGKDIFLVSTKAGGTGLNLTAADRVVLMDLSFNPQDNRQAEDRAHRLGQTRPVTVSYMITADTVEEKVVRANVNKMALDYKFGGQKSMLGSSGLSGLAEKADQDGDQQEEAEGSEDEEIKKNEAKEAENAAYQAMEKELGLS